MAQLCGALTLTCAYCFYTIVIEWEIPNTCPACGRVYVHNQRKEVNENATKV